jgi:small GTP-binding protein
MSDEAKATLVNGANGANGANGTSGASATDKAAEARTLLEAFFEKKSVVTTALRDVSAIAGEVGAQSLKERIEKDLVKKLDEDRFHLVIVGEFNHGKTTFVNALLGEAALPTGVTPTTASIHHLKYSDHPEASVVYTGGRRESIPFADARKFAVGGGANAEDVDFLEIGYPAALLKERILLVDTPGVNDLSLQRADITYSYIPRADAVLFLLDAGQILKESERVFLNDKLLKASRDKIVFVITKWDLLDEGEQQQALAYAKEHLSKLVRDPQVFPVSAENALSGNAAASGLPDLLAHLTGFLAEERGRIMLDNALGEGISASVLLEKGIGARRRSLAMKVEELDRRIAMLEEDLAGRAGTIEQRRVQIREEVQGIKVGARKDLERFVDDMIRQLPNVIDSAKSGALKQFLPAFLEDEFKKWAEAETKEMAAQLELLAEKTIALVREDAHDSSKRVSEVLGTDHKRLDVSIDTFAYDVGVVALLVGGLGVMFINPAVGAILAVAGPVLALVMKGKVDEEFKKQAKERAPEVLRAAALKIAPKLDEMIDEFGNKLDAWVVNAGEELHREVLEVLRATKTARAHDEQDETKAKEEVESKAKRLEVAKAHIEELRSALWTPKEKVRVADTLATTP